MSPLKKLKETYNACSDKQAKFVDLLVNGQERPEAYKNAGYKPKNRRIAQIAASKLLTTNTNVMAYYEAKKAVRDVDLQRVVNITRITQLKSLEKAKELAASLENPSAMVSAIREQNEMLGYHRELAANPEKEAEKAAMLTKEQELAEEFAQERTANEARGRLKLTKTG